MGSMDINPVWYQYQTNDPYRVDIGGKRYQLARSSFDAAPKSLRNQLTSRCFSNDVFQPTKKHHQAIFMYMIDGTLPNDNIETCNEVLHIANQHKWSTLATEVTEVIAQCANEK
ncbi:unnamed protein product [Periconia digitata]|uniref:Uncharacterized protein n=1 Tax=Periconia digitata TaxID=1303443 RepID=A0A9W4UKY7_9PLEO|nr:unnamed protein product [Periconia digitata]